MYVCVSILFLPQHIHTYTHRLMVLVKCVHVRVSVFYFYLNTYTHTHTLLIPSQVDGTNEVRTCTCVSVFYFYIITLTHTLFKITKLLIRCTVCCVFVCLLISHALSFFFVFDETAEMREEEG